MSAIGVGEDMNIEIKRDCPRQAFWNNIGRELSGSDPDLALKQAGLSWEPRIVPITYSFDGVTRTATNNRLLINGKTGKEIAPVSDAWVPVGNREFYNSVSRALSDVGGYVARGQYVEGSKSSLRMGDRAVILVSSELPELGYSLFSDDQEAHSSRIVFYNHHTPGCGMGSKAVVVRLACLNGAIAVNTALKVREMHVETGVARFRNPVKLIQQYKEAIAKQRMKEELLAKAEVTDEDALDHMIDFFGDKKKSITEQPLAVRIAMSIYTGEASEVLSDQGVSLDLNDYTHKTAYGILQACTAYYSHFRQYSTGDNAIKSSVFGTAARHQAQIESALERAYAPRKKVKGGIVTVKSVV